MTPAQKRFRPDDAALPVHLRLIIELELLCRDR
jgi:hypothetical protein